MAPPSGHIAHHQHGKSRVRLGRVWREGSVHHIVEWSVNISLFSDCERAFSEGDNADVVATDTMKNTVYVLGKQCHERTSVEDFACMLAKHFVSMYPVVHGTKVNIVEKPWQRAIVGGQPHDHGFHLGSERHIVEVEADSTGCCTVTSGIEELALLKTTQAGFEGFIHDKYTLLPDTRERIVASSVLAKWKYSSKPRCFTKSYADVKDSLTGAFFGPARGGTYSPSVQNTLYMMGQAVLDKYPEIEDVYLNMPNLHFIPMNLPTIGIKFADDIYAPTSEPHGTIEARLSRGPGSTHKARL